MQKKSLLFSFLAFGLLFSCAFFKIMAAEKIDEASTEPDDSYTEIKQPKKEATLFTLIKKKRKIIKYLSVAVILVSVVGIMIYSSLAPPKNSFRGALRGDSDMLPPENNRDSVVVNNKSLDLKNSNNEAYEIFTGHQNEQQQITTKPSRWSWQPIQNKELEQAIASLAKRVDKKGKGHTYLDKNFFFTLYPCDGCQIKSKAYENHRGENIEHDDGILFWALYMTRSLEIYKEQWYYFKWGKYHLIANKGQTALNKLAYNNQVSYTVVPHEQFGGGASTYYAVKCDYMVQFERRNPQNDNNTVSNFARFAIRKKRKNNQLL